MDSLINEKGSEDIKQNSELGSFSFKEIITIGGQAAALFIAIIYACGFLTLNSYFYRYGVSEIGIASSSYLVAGSIFILYMVTYGLFGGRAIVLMITWLDRNIKKTASIKYPSLSDTKPS